MSVLKVITSLQVFSFHVWMWVKREVLILLNLQGGPNIIALLSCNSFRCSKDKDETPKLGLVFEHVANKHFRYLYPTFTDYDIRYCTQNLIGNHRTFLVFRFPSYNHHMSFVPDF